MCFPFRVFHKIGNCGIFFTYFLKETFTIYSQDDLLKRSILAQANNTGKGCELKLKHLFIGIK
jgi:hypothetical protein